jgi:hypothetical protein
MRVICSLLAALFLVSAGVTQPDAQRIIEKSVVANDRDYRAAPGYNHTETDKGPHGNKTFQVTLIMGSPYRRLIAIDGEPLSPSRMAQEERRQREVIARRSAETVGEREKRIAKDQKGRDRDRSMMEQLTKALTFRSSAKLI